MAAVVAERKFERTARALLRKRLLSGGIICALAMIAAGGTAQTPSNSNGPLRTLTTTREVHSLSHDEASRGYPVHLRVVVTYYDPYIDPRHAAMFVHDASGAVFVALPSGPALPIQAGTVIELTGVSGPGDYAPIVAAPQVKVVAESQVPQLAPRVTMQQLLSGSEDGQWVEVEGLVHAVRKTEKNVIFDLATLGGPVSATTRREAGADYDHLVDALVRVHANAAPVFNRKRQLVGVHIYFPTLAELRVVEAAVADPFTEPAVPIPRLLQFKPGELLPHRVRVRGRVTLHWPGRMLCIQQASDGLCMQTGEASAVHPGDLVDVVGFPVSRDYKPTLENSEFREAGPNQAGPPAVAVAAEKALQGQYDGQLVHMEGELIGEDLAAGDPTLMLRAGDFLFPAILDKNLIRQGIPAWQERSVLRVTGICSVDMDAESTTRQEGAVRPKSVRILLRSLDDVQVLKTPSWWTPKHALEALGLVAVLTFAAIGWIVVLRRRVEQQTQMIRRNEDRLRHISQHDALTNLPNRILLRDRLNMALERTKRFKSGLGLLMVDLDQFKEVNDSLGHRAGDQLLCEVARRISTSVRKTDTVARIGGDEFIVLLPDLTQAGVAEYLAAKIVAAIAEPMDIAQQRVPISASVGVCTLPVGGTDAASLLHSVDVAMYQAKAKGRNGYQLYTPEMDLATRRRQDLEAALKHAIESREFELRFQPVVCLESGRAVGVEAFVYWRNQQQGLLLPSEFLPLAEETGLIVPLGEWMMGEACRQVAEVERQLDRSLLLTLPLSPRQFQQLNLVEQLERRALSQGRAAHSLEIEITENLLSCGSLKITGTLDGIRSLDVLLAIDDFGIGFSSLSYLMRFGVDHLRIDASFIHDCTLDRRSAAVTRAMIAMARDLDTAAVAEGVETADQVQFLQEAGCEFAQGSFFGRPVVAAELPSILASLERAVH